MSKRLGLSNVCVAIYECYSIRSDRRLKKKTDTDFEKESKHPIGLGITVSMQISIFAIISLLLVLLQITEVYKHTRTPQCCMQTEDKSPASSK